MAINSFMLSMGNVLGTCSDPFSVLNLTNSKWFRLVSRFCKQMKSKFSRICMVVLSQPEVWAGSRQLQRNTWMYRHFNSKVFKVSVAKRNCCNATWWLHGAPKKKKFLFKMFVKASHGSQSYRELLHVYGGAAEGPFGLPTARLLIAYLWRAHS